MRELPGLRLLSADPHPSCFTQSCKEIPARSARRQTRLSPRSSRDRMSCIDGPGTPYSRRGLGATDPSVEGDEASYSSAEKSLGNGHAIPFVITHITHVIMCWPWFVSPHTHTAVIKQEPSEMCQFTRSSFWPSQLARCEQTAPV